MMRRQSGAAVAILILALVVGGVVALRRTSASPIVRTVAVGKSPTALLLDERTHRAFVVNSDSNDVTVIDTRTGALVCTTRVGPRPAGGPRGMAAVDERTGRVFIVNGGANSVDVLDAASGTLRRIVTVGAAPWALDLDERAGRVFVLNSAIHSARHSSVSMLDARSGAVLHTTPVGWAPNAMAVDTRMQRVFVSNATVPGTVSVLDAYSGRVLGKVTVGNNGGPLVDPSALQVDATAGRAYVETNDRVSIVDMRQDRLVRTVTGRTLSVDPAHGRAFIAAPDGTIQVVTNGGRTIRSGARLDQPYAATVDTRSGRLTVETKAGPRVLDGRTGMVIRVPTAGQDAYPTVMDPRRGQALVITYGTFDYGNNDVPVVTSPGRANLIDQRRGTVLWSAPLNTPIDAVLDESTGQALVLDAGGLVRAPDPWGWMPSWLRRRLPFIPPPGTRLARVPSSVSIIAMAR